VYAIHNRGDAVTLAHVHPDTGQRVTVLELPGLGEAPEGMRRCGKCGTADTLDEFGRFRNHQPAWRDVPCYHPVSPVERGPFVVALPDFREGDKVMRQDDDPADVEPEEREALVGTVVSVAPAVVRVSWPLDGYRDESPDELDTLVQARADEPQAGMSL